MAHTAHKSEAAMEEIQFSPEQIDSAAQTTADLIRRSKHIVFFTGAGISTSAGVPDYRGPQGAWTLAAKNEQRTERTVPMTSAVGTPTHMAMVELQRQGKLQFVISQNVDGLHRKSGIDADKIAELHGNSNLEECDVCGARVHRSFMIHGSKGHYTGRKCVAEGCTGDLRDTIINFGEDLPSLELANGFSHSEAADLHICLGSSLTVSPACDMPMATKKKGGKLIIVNLQRTPLDNSADLRVHGRIDEFMERVMHHLGFTIPPFVLNYRAAVWKAPNGTDLCVSGVTSDGLPSSLFESVRCNGQKVEYKQGANPLILPNCVGTASTITAAIFPHYNEPEVTLKVPTGDATAVCSTLTFTAGSDAVIVTNEEVETSSSPSSSSTMLPSYKKGKAPSRVKSNSKPIQDGTGIDYSGWFAVTPLHHCEHCESVSFREGVTLDPQAACQHDGCGNVGENMQCLSCFEVFCGRHVNQHMIAHHEQTNHPIVVGFADLSFWCYPCEAYISPSNRHISLIYRLLHNAKFGFEGPVGASSSSPASPVKPDSVLPMARESTTITEDDELDQGFAVNPVAECMHCRHISKDPLPSGVGLQSPCQSCNHVGECMICLTCHAVFCGRHQNGHMLEHHDATGHQIVMGFKDLSCWCYLCDTYISHNNRDVSPTYMALCAMKK